MAKKKEYVDVGGQAVIEGVMMRSPQRMALAVRGKDGIVVERTRIVKQKPKYQRWPVIRGVFSFIDSMVTGFKLIEKSMDLSGMAQEEKPTKFDLFIEKKLGKKAEDVMMPVALTIAVPLAIALFVLLPSMLANWVRPHLTHWLLVNLAEGLIRLMIFILYMWGISRVKDIDRTYRYHGAEHKMINCFETYGRADVALAKPLTTRHPRCGTSFLLIVMLVSIIIFSFFGEMPNLFLRALSRLLMLPAVAGVSYEVLKLLAHSDNILSRALRAPGLWMQGLSTKEPDEGMLEVAKAAFDAAYYEELPAERSWRLKEEADGHTAGAAHDSVAFERPDAGERAGERNRADASSGPEPGAAFDR